MAEWTQKDAVIEPRTTDFNCVLFFTQVWLLFDGKLCRINKCSSSSSALGQRWVQRFKLSLETHKHLYQTHDAIVITCSLLECSEPPTSTSIIFSWVNKSCLISSPHSVPSHTDSALLFSPNLSLVSFFSFYLKQSSEHLYNL